MAWQECPNGHTKTIGEGYCSECGAKLVPSAGPNCICGCAIFAHEKFCGRCGRKIERKESISPARDL